MRALLLLLLATTIGCYRPNAPGGSYLCGTHDECPDGLSCTCGLCVQSEEEAACSFAIDATDGAHSLSVEEHEPFSVTIHALTKAGGAASKFTGNVRLSSTWGDVCVGTDGCTGMPDQVQLTAGTATAMVQLNRETIAPQSAILRAEFAGNVGSSGKLRINVDSPVFQRDAQPVVAPLTVFPPTSFGFATQLLMNVSVLKVEEGWRMYFDGVHVQKVAGKDQAMAALGVATSTDGKKFNPPGSSVFESPTGAADSRGFSSAYRNTRGTQVYFARGPFSVDAAQSRSLGYLSIVRLDSTIPTGDGGFTLLTSPAVLAGGTGDSGCPFCTAIDTPVVIPDPDPSLTGGGPNASLMYFAALQQVTDFANNTTYQVAVVRASSPDGESFVVDASPLLKSTAEEQVLYSPRVIVDGTTYKMFYSLGTEAESILDPCSALATFRVGYATSSDGYFWVRSPRNSSRKTKAIPNPPPAVFDVNTMPGQWDTGRSIQVGSVLPVDGVDPASGLVLYYTAYERQLTGACMPNGVGRAIRR